MKQINWNEDLILAVVIHNGNAPAFREQLENKCIGYTDKAILTAPAMREFHIETTFREAEKIHEILSQVTS